MKYEYKTHAAYRGYGWIEPLTDSEDSLIEGHLARRICEELNTLQAEVERLMEALYELRERCAQECERLASIPRNTPAGEVWALGALACADEIRAMTLKQEYGDQVLPLYTAPQPAEQHPDDAVDRFAAAMKSKLAKKRQKENFISKAIFLVGVLIVLLGLIYYTPAHASLAPDAKVPILLYHTRTISEPCEYGSDDLLALEQDLETLHSEGFTVMPVYWLVQWALGWRDGSTLPDKVVGITIDDGYDADYLDRTPAPEGCPPRKSARTILHEFRERYKDELPDLSPHASLFVIASREVRQLLDPIDQHFGDNWWAAAHADPLMEVYSHGMDHDHTVIMEKLWEPLMEVWLPAAGHSDGNWAGRLRPDRINTLESNRIHIADAAEYIADRIGAWPDLFAHPMGRVSDYTRQVYFPNYFHEHGTVAAFCTEVAGRGPQPRNYMTRNSDRWCLPRLTHGYSWRTPEEFLTILRGAEQ